MKFFLLICLFVLSSCGESPVFNHQTEKEGPSKNPRALEADIYSFQKTDFSFGLIWEEGPRLGESRFLVRAWNKKTGSINGPYQNLPKDLHIYLWMSSMGHGSAPVKISKIADGEYEVSEVHFIMGGPWEIRFQLKDVNQVYDETVISLSI